jgi:hypothetical protein
MQVLGQKAASGALPLFSAKTFKKSGFEEISA